MRVANYKWEPGRYERTIDTHPEVFYLHVQANYCENVNTMGVLESQSLGSHMSYTRSAILLMKKQFPEK